MPPHRESIVRELPKPTYMSEPASRPQSICRVCGTPITLGHRLAVRHVQREPRKLMQERDHVQLIPAGNRAQ